MIKLLDHPPFCVLYPFFISISRKYWLIFTLWGIRALFCLCSPQQQEQGQQGRQQLRHRERRPYAVHAEQALRISEQVTMAATPRLTEVMVASVGRLTAPR